MKSASLLTLLDEVKERVKKERAKPTVERRKTKQEENYNKFVKQLYRKQRKRGLK